MRQRFLQAVGGTLRFTPSEADEGATVTSATVTLKRASGLDLPTPVEDAAATIAADGTLSYDLSGAQCPDPLTTGGASSPLNPIAPYYGTVSGHLYRAAWRYVIGGVTYDADQLYEVRRRILRPTLTSTEMERNLPAAIETLEADGITAVQDAMGDAWDDILDELASRGFDPDRVMDPDRLRRPHRVMTLVRLAQKWGPPWRQYAQDRAEEFQRVMGDALQAGDWYDRLADVQQQAGETQVPTIRLTR